MRTAFRRMAVLGLLLLPGATRAGDWAQLKPGMSRDETTAVLGTALFSTAGRGFEVAIYDRRAELVYLDGKLVTWTAPASSPNATAPADTWQFDQSRMVRPPATPARSVAPVSRGAILPAYRL